MDRTVSCATISGLSGPGSAVNEEVLRIPQSSNITGTSPLDCLMSYPGHSLVGGVLPLCRGAFGVYNSTLSLQDAYIYIYKDHSVDKLIKKRIRLHFFSELIP